MNQRKIRLTPQREAYNFSKPYIIAELGSNHNGDMKLAEKMIREAKRAGADCVKFQSWSKDTIFSKKVYEENHFLKDDYRQRTDFSLEKIVEEFSISEQELCAMKKIADEVEIDCISTPFSQKEVDFLVEEMKAPFIKVASMDVNNYPFLEYIAKKKKTIVISNGLSELHEFDKAIRTIENAGNSNIIILHCVAIYPPKDEEVNLRNIETLQKLYTYPVGFSDHTLSTSIPIASVTFGACVIEKHFTLDKGMFGWDHKISADKHELKEICSQAKRVWKALGTNRIMVPENDERKKAFRRSIVAARDITKGHVVEEKDLDYKRPGTGLAPEAREYILGRKAARNIKHDEILTMKDF